MVDDIDEIFPTIKFREEQQESRKVLENWFNGAKPKQNIGVEPMKRKEEGVKEEIPKHPWDIAHEIIQEQNKEALAIKWSAISTETLFDEQFLNVLHTIAEITDTSPLRDVAMNLPKDIYEIVKQYERIPAVSVETTDNLIYNIGQTYYYAVTESLCKMIKAVRKDKGHH